MSRLYQVAVYLGVCAALSSCDRLAGGFLAEPKAFSEMPVEVTAKGGVVTLRAQHAFSAVACGPVSSDEDEPPPATWRAHCVGFDDCVVSVSYGDAVLEHDIQPQALLPGRCYRCNLKGSKGWGQAEFEITSFGDVRGCTKQP